MVSFVAKNFKVYFSKKDFFNFSKMTVPKQYYISLKKLIDTLALNKIISEGDYLNIYFDNYNTNSKFKNQWSIEPIGYTIVRPKSNEIINIDYYDIKKVIPEVMYINLSVNKSLNPARLSSLKKELWKIVVHVKPLSFITPNGDELTYYKSEMKPINETHRDKLAKELHKNKESAKLRYIYELAEKCNSDEVDYDFPDLDFMY